MAKSALRGAFGRDDATPLNPQILILATQAADQASLLTAMVRAYTALEELITHEQDTLERAATRSALGALMRALNGEMERQVDGLVRDTTALCAVVAEEVGTQ